MIWNKNGRHLHYRTRGDGPVVILIHGVAASLHHWEMLTQALVSSGYRTYAVDLLGHGDSAKPQAADHYHAQEVYTALEPWIDHLKLREPAVLIGHSFGGFLSLKYSLQHPGAARGMVLINPFYSQVHLSPYVRWLNRRPELSEKALQLAPLKLIQTVMGWDFASRTQFPLSARQQIALDLKRASPRIVNIPNTVPDLTPHLEQITIPAQVIWGQEDLTLDPASFPKLISALPHACGYNISGCGHQPHIGRPQLVNQLILEFIGSLPN